MHSSCTLVIVVVVWVNAIHCSHIEGIWNPSSPFLKVIARFGIQKTDINHRDDTNGYAFGNITLLNHGQFDPGKSDAPHSPPANIYNNAVMLFVNRTLFKHIYNIFTEFNREHETEVREHPLDFQQSNLTTHLDELKSNFCANVYETIKHSHYDEKCNNQSKQSLDFVRYVPCQNGKLCNDPYQSHNLTNYQFTYVIDNQNEPTFWFLLLISCQRVITTTVHDNVTTHHCSWNSSSNSKSLLSYDVWMVNGHPSSASNKPIDFDHQFSFEQQNLMVYIMLNIGYIILLILQFYAISLQKIRNLNCLFTISLSLHCLAYFFICLHKIVFAHNGKGFETLFIIAEVMKIMSSALFMLFVIIIAKGCPISKPEIFSKTMLVLIWSLYTIIKIILFVWIKGSMNTVEEVDEYHTLPGWISLGFRIILMIWFLHELRHTMMLEQDPRKLRFYLHFGAGILVWFVHLPLVVVVALQIDLLWRYKIIIGFTSAADMLAYAIITRLMWQTRKSQFFSTDVDIDLNEDLEYYDDNLISNSETYKFSNANIRSKLSYDNHISCDITTIKT